MTDFDSFRREWLSHLAAERRLSPKTLEAYSRDLGQFHAFLTEHLGGAPSFPISPRSSPSTYAPSSASAGATMSATAP